MLKPKRKTIFLLLCCICLLFVVLHPHSVSARGLVPCGGYNADGSAEPRCQVGDIFILIARLTNWLIAMAGVYAAYLIIGAGFWLTVSQGEEEKISQHKKALSNAIVGFVLVLMAFMFVNTVVNYIFLRNISGCKIDLTSPLTYLTIDSVKNNSQGKSK